MFKKLQKKWQVSGWNLFFILSTFALGGSACGRIGSKILNILSIEKGFLWGVLYVLLITLLWPICVLIISIPLGQYRFFKNYIARIWKKISGQGKKNSRKQHIAIFASGKGSNALNIIQYFDHHPTIQVSLIVAGSAQAGVVEVAKSHQIPCLVMKEDLLQHPGLLIQELTKFQIDFIILAGYLKKIPVELINSFKGNIINIHPALLPSFGGKGMYGSRVHEAVILSGNGESGITIHWVDEVYDHGTTIFQATCKVEPGDNEVTLEKKVRELELKHYPHVIEAVMQKQTVR